MRSKFRAYETVSRRLRMLKVQSLLSLILFISLPAAYSVDLRGNKYKLSDGTICQYKLPDMPRTVEFRWPLPNNEISSGDTSEKIAYGCAYISICDRAPKTRSTFLRTKKRSECPPLDRAMILADVDTKDVKAGMGKGEWDTAPGNPQNYQGRTQFVPSLGVRCSIAYAGFPLRYGLAPSMESGADMQEACFIVSLCGTDNFLYFGTAPAIQTREGSFCPDVDKYAFHRFQDPDYRGWNPRPANPNFPAVESVDAIIDRDSLPPHTLVNGPAHSGSSGRPRTR
jgi:hypothetical protein